MSNLAIDRRVLTIRPTTSVTVSDPYVNQVLANASDGALTVTLVSRRGRIEHRVSVQKTDASANAVTVSAGSLSKTLAVQNDALVFEQDDLGAWHVFSSPQGAVGQQASATDTLILLANVAEDETVTIGADVYDIEIVNTDSTDNTANSDFDNTTDPLTVVDAVTSYANVTFTVGALIRIENEILRVTAVVGNNVTFARGASGTTTAAHADANDIFVGDGIDPASTIAVGLVATLTPAAFSAALVDDINTEGTEPVTAAASGDNVVITATAAGTAGNGIECAETLAGAGNAWLSPTTFGGYDVQVGTIRDEIPAGVVDGANQDFEFLGTPFAVFLDGVKYGPNEYTVSGNIVTINTAPASGVVTGLTQ